MMTEDTVYKVLNGQARHLKTMHDFQEPIATCDDGGDYVSSALDAMTILHEMCFQQGPDVQAFEQWINTTEAEEGGYITLYTGQKIVCLYALAYDGLCDELTELMKEDS